jgi:DNA-binding winged helix-turn-helix (wHTH) protein/TolB-like protein/Flp pilus assembly protein TadD
VRKDFHLLTSRQTILERSNGSLKILQILLKDCSKSIIGIQRAFIFMVMSSQAKRLYEFGPFSIEASERVLLRDRQVVQLTPKAFDLLLVLVENSGHLVEKDELMRMLWPDTFVEEANLTNNISLLRRALAVDNDHQYIETVARRGYRFVAEVAESAEPSSELILEEQSSATHTLEESASPEPSVSVSQRAERRKSFMSLPLVAVAGALTLASAAYYFWPRHAASQQPIKSIAVLPFKPLVAESRDEALEMGMADTLIMRLSNLGQITVRPLSAVRRYTNLEQDAVKAGQELRVESVLEGNIQKSGDQVRVRVSLVRVADGRPVWASQFDEKVTSVFAAQDSISEQVAGLLAVKLTGEEREQLAKRDTASAEAYQAYVRGRYVWSKRTYESLEQAIEYFKQAIAVDPQYALAYAGLADTYNALGGLGFFPQKEASPKAREMATKALELDDNLAEAHGSLAAALVDYYWDWPEAEKHLKRAVALNPSYAHAHGLYSACLSNVGRHEEAIAEAERAQTLDPASSTSVGRLGMTYYFAGQYDRASEYFRRALDLDPNDHVAHFDAGLVYQRQGKYEEALTEMRRARALGMKDAFSVTGHIYAVSGRKREAHQVLAELDQLSKREYVPAFHRAYIYIGLCDNERAFEWLEKAYKDREWYLWLLKQETGVDPIRSDPRFQDLLRRIGLAR